MFLFLCLEGFRSLELTILWLKIPSNFFFTLTIKQSTPKIFSTMNVLRHLIIGMRLFFYSQIILLLFSSDPVRRSNLNGPYLGHYYS